MTPRTRSQLRIERLESRLTPASVLAYTDVDGDKVTIKSSVGDLAGHAAFIGGGTDGQLHTLFVNDATFKGADITFSVVKAGGGDGLAAVGRITGGAINLGAVVVKGDLGRIDSTSTIADIPALASLTVRTVGRYGLATQDGLGEISLVISGELGKLKVVGDVKDAFIFVYGAHAAVGSVTIGGSLIGGRANFTGLIRVGGDIGPVKIGRDLVGAGGNESGKIDAGGKLKSLTIGGSVIGGNGNYDTFTDGNGVLHDGQIFAVGDIGTVKIGRDVRNTTIKTHASLTGPLTIGASLVDAGIFSDGDMGVVKIVQDSRGGISAGGNLASVKIGGTSIAGITSTGDMGLVKIGKDFSGVIAAGGTLAGVTVGDSMLITTTIHSTGQMGVVKIAHDMDFGTTIDSDAGISGVVVGGSIFSDFPGTLAFWGSSITSAGEIGMVKIGHHATLRELKTTAGGIGSLMVGGTLRIYSNIGTAITMTGKLGKAKIGTLAQTGIVAPAGIGTFQVADDMEGSTLQTSGKLASLSVGGSFEGSHVTAAEIENVTIKGSMQGGQIGGVVADSVLGSVKIGGNLEGIITGGTIASVSVGGSLIGNPVGGSGWAKIECTGDLGTVKIRGDVRGVSLPPGATGGAGFSAAIKGVRIRSVFIGGSLIAGTDDSSNPLNVNFYSASILAAKDIGSIVIKGDVVGSVGLGGDVTPVFIVANGQPTPTATTDLAIGKITVGGRVERANILAGYLPGFPTSLAMNANAQIGTVSVGGDWIASNIVAGVENFGANGIDNNGGDDDNLNFGTPNDHFIDNAANSISRIGSVTIKGALIGTGIAGDHFGFVAHQIGSFKCLGFTAPLTAGANVPFEYSLITGDATIREV